MAIAHARLSTPLARCLCAGLVLGCAVLASSAHAATATAPATVTGAALQGDVTRTAVLLSLLAIIPAIIVSTTSFLRIVVVLAMLRHAFGMPQTPPNIVLTSLALFMTAFLMGSTVDRLNEDTLQPYLAGSIDTAQAMDSGSEPLRDFMLRHTRERDIEMVYAVARAPLPASADEISLMKLIPAFMLNELRVAFTIGFVILLPFLLIDLVVSAILLALGMMMVPPQTISLPIKVLMFVLIDGWSLVMQGLLGSFA